MTCSNDKCNKEFSGSQISALHNNVALQYCSMPCYFYHYTYMLHDGQKIPTAKKFLLDVHPKWLEDITPFLEPWEVELVQYRSMDLEKEMKQLILDSIESLKKKYIKD